MTRRILFAVLLATPLLADYNYYFSDTLTSINTSNWTQNPVLSTSSSGLTSSDSNGGSLISSLAVPAPSNQYEVKTTLTLTQSGGTFITYLRASSNALYANGNTGTYYAVVLSNPTFSGNSCTATLALYKSVSGSITNLSSNSAPCHNGMVLRSVVTNNNVSSQIIVYVDGLDYGYAVDGSIATGQPGVGVASAPSGNSISRVDLGQLDVTRPLPIDSQLVGITPFPNRVDMQWPGTVDNPGGSGVAFYLVVRNGSYFSSQNTTFSDTTVSPGTPYSYNICALDYHLNSWCTPPISVTTPPTGAIDPREVGVRPNGTYWGAAGEQVDMRSGNLNYSIPLIKAMGRGGWGVGFNLSYNSQNWRQDAGGTWQLGRDSGYGYGWRMQAGSLTPVYQDYFTIHHYLFIDSTGAEYRLDQNTNGVWTTKEAIYVYYDSNAGRLYFRDGSFWVLGSTSSGTEQDSGTMYPTLMQDTNGNQVTITYNTGNGVNWNNSSSRVGTISDVRSASAYTFTYNGDTIPHLIGLSNSIGTAENYTFGYISNYPLTSPFGGQSYGTFSLLQCASSATIPGSTTFAYDSTTPQNCGNYTATTSGPGELAQMTTPYAGHIRWTHQTFTFGNNRTFREVNNRFLSTSSSAPETTYSIWFQSDNNLPFHTYSGVNDPNGISQKAFAFGTDTNNLPSYGLVKLAESRLHQYPNINGSHSEYYYWTTNSTGNPYIYSSQIVQDNYNPTAVTKTVNQTLDQYGNATQMQVYDYGNNATPARTYTNTYLTDTNHTSRYMFNRLASSVVTDGTKSTTLVQNTYDATTPADLPGVTAHDASYNTALLTRGNVTTSVTPAGTSIAAYDIGGNVVTNIVNGVTTNVATSLTTNYAAPSQISVNSLSSGMNWNAALFPTSESGPNGDTASIGYSSGRPSSTTSPFGAVTNYTYADNAPASKTATTNGHWVKTTMDGFGRTVKTETGNGSTTVSIVDTVYVSCGCSPLGKIGSQSQPYAPGGAASVTTYTYDGMGRTLSVLAPDGVSTTNYSYSGNTVTVTDPAGKTKTFTMDAFGNLTKVQEPDPTLGTVTTNYTYDILNHLTQVSMPRGANTQTRTFVYNTGNTVGVRLLSATNPENGTVTYTYNTDGTLNTKTDAKNQVFTYSYDGYTRPTQISVSGNVLRTFMYDTNTLDTTFSGSYTAGRLVAVQHTPFYPGTVNAIQFTEMYSYTQPGQAAKKRLQVTETLPYGQGLTIPRTLNLDATQTYDTEGKMTSVNYPTTYGLNGASTTGPTYNYQFDPMHRPNLLTDQNSNTVANNVQYGSANQLLSISYGGVNETRQYNAMLQMTHLSIPGQLDITYAFPSANNGKISSQTDNLSGETISYQYDSLNRLLSASASGWNQTFGYDGFGSLVSKSGTNAPVLSIGVDPATNRINSPYQPYDANGNQLTGGLGYDPENRLQTAPGVQYAYDSQNKRIWRGTFDGNGNLTAQEAYFYGVGGQKLGTYALTVVQQNNQQPQLTDSNTDSAVFFGGKRILTGSGTFIQDRLGSSRRSQSGAAMSFYPYGEDKGTTQPNDQLKFATYTRDVATGLDYADQRYYANNFGRFMSPDPYKASAGPDDPQSWNRYAYVQGDPVNYDDPGGLFQSVPVATFSVTAVDWAPSEDLFLMFYSFYFGPQIQRPMQRTPVYPPSDFPECNPKGNRTIENKLNFINDHYADAAGVAAGIQKDIGKSIDTDALATMFLQWSAWESHYGQDPANIAENNYFGAQGGTWSGTSVPCMRDNNPIPSNSKNACFQADLTWGQELSAVLNSPSGSTRITYINALETALLSNRAGSPASALQSIANNGWNSGNPTYGSTITSGISIGPLINCLKKNGYI